MSLQEVAPRARWPRSTKFALTEAGRQAELAYREQIVSAREEPGRASYDAARASWATRHGLQPDDGLYLGELAQGPGTLPFLVEALHTCGKGRLDAVAALERLHQAGLVVAGG